LRWPMYLLPLALVGVTAIAPQPSVTEAQTAANCQFQLGFRTLHDMAPGVVGDCIENEWHNAENGDGLQRTTRGLMAWRKFDNWTAFTDGYMTWINGPLGLQSRLNTERFAWEGVAPPPAPPSSGSGGSNGGSAGGGSDSNSSQTNTSPDLTLRLSDDRVDAGTEFTIRLDANDDNGVSSVWWWATNTDDWDLRNTHSFDCRGASPCRQTWNVSTTDNGDIKIHAVARDENGVRSDEVVDTVRVRKVTPTPTPSPTATPSPTPKV
jgi:hypothetical protein